MSPSYLFVLLALGVISSVYGDIYMQFPPGNNNRYNEEGDRETATRLFNSQNNARGGYCWGPELTYYEGSILAVEWTNQHACGNDNTHCDLVLQYMCSTDDMNADPTKIIRDGTTTDRIPEGTDPNAADAATSYYNYQLPDTDDGNGRMKFKYGMNEPYSNYASCVSRTRNKGLWIADRGVGNSAMSTRQSNGGTRYGFECTEERDYYPYWHPAPWKDIVVFADDTDKCDWFQSESQNVKAKNWCAGNTTDQKAANNEGDCIRAQGTWSSQPSWGIGKPECKAAPWNRDNHLGNGAEGHTNSYNWTLPRSGQEDCIKNGNCTCILRMRYNITVGELNGMEDSSRNGKNSPIQRGIDGNDKVLKTVDGVNYTFTIDTSQTGRVFQDRSYMFRLAPRPRGVPSSAKIYNLNVRGKRGNIVQTYPATEYDFVPTFLTVTQDDYIHFQWTGCDTNSGNAAGQGRSKTDRSNIVQIADMSKNFPLNETEIQGHNMLFPDFDVRRRMAMIDQQNCLSYEELKEQEANGGENPNQNTQNCMLLNAAPTPRFTGVLQQMKNTGTFSYMSSRNNNFSNRSQKGQITVKSGWAAWKTAVIVVGGVAAIAIGAAVGTLFYVHKHPLSRAAEVVHKIPGFSKV